MARTKIVDIKTQDGRYYDLVLQDLKTKSTYHAFMHESEYKLRVFEEKVLGCVVSEELLEEHKDLINDVAHYNRCMEECD